MNTWLTGLLARIEDEAVYACHDSPMPDDAMNWCAQHRAWDDFCSGCRTNAMLHEAADLIRDLRTAPGHAPRLAALQFIADAPGLIRDLSTALHAQAQEQARILAQMQDPQVVRVWMLRGEMHDGILQDYRREKARADALALDVARLTSKAGG